MYLQNVQAIPTDQLVYVDKNGLKESSNYHHYGRAPHGEPIQGHISGKRATQMSFIAALNQQQLKAMFRFAGTMHTGIYNHWGETYLVPTLRRNQMVVMDNVGSAIPTRLKRYWSRWAVSSAFSQPTLQISTRLNPCGRLSNREFAATGDQTKPLRRQSMND